MPKTDALIDRLLVVAWALLTCLVMIVIAKVVRGTPVAAQRQVAAQTVRVAGDDALMLGILQQLRTLQAAVATSAAVRATIASGARPIGQVGDALKVYPTLPQDPCSGIDKGNIAISQTASTKLVSGLSGMRIFVCAARVVAGAAEIPSFTEGTGAACATGTTAVSGSTTAANGESYAANGGFQAGTGAGSIMVTNKAGDDLCLAQSGSNRLAGNLVYAYGKP